MTKPLTVSLGEVLWDILPDGRVLGGAPANVAWHAARLGADARIVSAVGDDALGRGILGRLAEMGLDTRGVVTVPDRPTGTVEATPGADGGASYVIHERVAWDAVRATPEVLRLAASASAVNFGSLAQREEAGREATLAILDAVPATAIRIFDINLRRPHMYPEVLDAGFRRAAVVKMNDEELPLAAELFGWSGPPEAALDKLLAAYRGVRHVIVTRGAGGAWWRSRERFLQRPAGVCPRVVDTIGAGDSVTAAVMMGLLKGWEEEAILGAALEIAAFVCSRRGGTPVIPESLAALFA